MADKPNQPQGGLSLMEGVVLDMVAEGKSPRQISEVLGIQPHEAAKMAYDLLDREIVTDTEQRRKLQVYRLEKIVEALWQRTMKGADKDDVRNLIEVLDKLNVLLALNKEQDAELAARMHQHQFAAYMAALMGLVKSFQLVVREAANWGEEQWAVFAAGEMESAQKQMMREIE